MKTVVIGLSMFFLLSCGGATSSEILSKKKMQAVLWDIIRADVYSNQIIRQDSSKNSKVENVKLQQQIFSIHKISKESFYNSYSYYQAHPNDMQAILDSISTDKNKAEKDKYLKSILQQKQGKQ